MVVCLPTFSQILPVREGFPEHPILFKKKNKNYTLTLLLNFIIFIVHMVSPPPPSVWNSSESFQYFQRISWYFYTYFSPAHSSKTESLNLHVGTQTTCLGGSPCIHLFPRAVDLNVYFWWSPLPHWRCRSSYMNCSPKVIYLRLKYKHLFLLYKFIRYFMFNA